MVKQSPRRAAEMMTGYTEDSQGSHPEALTCNWEPGGEWNLNRRGVQKAEH